MTAPAKACELVERFDAHRDVYQSDRYNEAQLREEFINPLFEALGWDVYNRRGYADAYKEVIHEAAIKIGGRTKAPDYCFRAGGGVRSFFLEAKKPSVDIGEAISPAYQLRRYAWSAKLPVSVLTDFEEFAVYDCRIRPDKNDKASVARALYLKYTDFVQRWDELVGLLAPESVRRGSLERFVSSKKIKKGTAEVDAAFLDEIESWRTDLARNFALRNPGLSQRDLNFAVGRTIDRMIFLRICEDRGIESYGALQSLQNGPAAYRRLGELFQRADDRYNSGLFHFSVERDRPGPPDELTLGLTLDDEPLKEILRRLYFPESPYEFSVFPAEILGQVYEQFLGKVIRLTEGHRAKVEQKPEVRKAGGVYYTPAYIVDYIVGHTVGRLLGEGTGAGDGGRGTGDAPFSPGTCAGSGEKDEEETGSRQSAVGGNEGSGFRVRGSGSADRHSEIRNQKSEISNPPSNIRHPTFTPARAAKLRILDPACGSGSFLLGAYEYLLTWHRDWYVADGAEKHARGRHPKLYRSPSDEWRLTTAEKKRILLGNIYGVDIDPQAVEVTKLSLLLKVLEGESGETLDNQLRVFHERALPDLAGNIKCGNSLIGPDFYNGRQLSLFNEEERWRINVFDWKDEFPEVFRGKDAGFDAVIGNPPYVRIQTLNKTQPDAVEYFGKHYAAAAKGNYDIYVLFIEKGFSLLNTNGLLGLILPGKFFATDYGAPLRKMLSERQAIDHIVDFRHGQVFPKVTTYTCLLFLSRTSCEFARYAAVLSPETIGENPPRGFFVSAKQLSDAPWIFAPKKHGEFLTRVRKNSVPLLELPVMISRGSSTGADQVFMLSSKRGKLLTRDGDPVQIEKELLRIPLYATDFGRYWFSPRSGERVIFPYRLTPTGYRVILEAELRKKFPRAFKYLVGRKREL
ncbi:MAG: Eco57I restriction-modification methylase domain-containing protein, partial [Planctomycetes bacterium]|nr:Eco57I restriction-modification methylase domain-containing protein [Planctomycetota bacterium]